MATQKMTLRVYQEIEVDVEFTVTGPTRGHRDSLGVPEEPDEDTSFEIESITDVDGEEVSFEDIDGGEDTVIEKL